jgi:hypothetical protein
MNIIQKAKSTWKAMSVQYKVGDIAIAICVVYTVGSLIGKLINRK